MNVFMFDGWAVEDARRALVEMVKAISVCPAYTGYSAVCPMWPLFQSAFCDRPADQPAWTEQTLKTTASRFKQFLKEYSDLWDYKGCDAWSWSIQSLMSEVIASSLDGSWDSRNGGDR